jgi:hypothetical protein
MNSGDGVSFHSTTPPVWGNGKKLETTSPVSHGGSENPHDGSKAASWDEIPVLESKVANVGITAADLRKSVPVTPKWLVPNLIARDWTILLTAREKGGKGTFTFYVVGALERGDATPFGPAVAPATTLVFTEEPDDSLREKLELFDIARAKIVHHWELAMLEWPEKIHTLVRMAVDEGHALLFIDNVSRAAGIEDEAGVALARAIEPLSTAAKEHGLAVWLDHHQRKSNGHIEDLFRGSTSVTGATEVNVAMAYPNGGKDRMSSRRRIVARGRVRAAIWDRTLELAGDTYIEVSADELNDKQRKLFSQSSWTADAFAKAIDQSESAARRYLDESPHTTCTGTGKRGDPYTYLVKGTTP